MDTIHEFLQYLQYERNYSDHTVAAYKNDLSQFCDHVGCTTESFDPRLVAVGDRRSPPCIRRRRPGGEEARPSWSCVRSWSWSSRRALLVYLPHNGPAQCRIVLDPVQILNS